MCVCSMPGVSTSRRPSLMLQGVDPIDIIRVDRMHDYMGSGNVSFAVTVAEAEWAVSVQEVEEVD